MSADDRVIRLRFDDRRPWGSRQHYFHFLWGYLLPALDQVLLDLREAPARAYALQSCGPVMDQRIREIGAWLAPSLRIVETEPSAGGAAFDERFVPRWDLWLRGRSSLRPRLLQRLHGLGLRHPVLDGIARVRDFAVSRALGEPATAAPALPAEERSGEWLLLKRSDEPSFYRRGGPAEKQRYGVTRRSIANLEELAAALARDGLPVRIYEPGRDDLAHQVRAYHAAAGVIGIRGAELANIVWMRPNSRVVMLVTPVKRENNAALHLAIACGLRMRQLAVDSDHPVVEARRVLDAST